MVGQQDLPGQFCVIKNAGRKVRTAFFAKQLIGCLLQQIRIQIKHPVRPSGRRCCLTIMGFAGNHQVYRSGRCNQTSTAIGKSQRPLLDHAQGIPFMNVTGKHLCRIFCPQQFHSRQMSQPPVFYRFVRHFSYRKPQNISYESYAKYITRYSAHRYNLPENQPRTSCRTFAKISVIQSISAVLTINAGISRIVAGCGELTSSP